MAYQIRSTEKEHPPGVRARYEYGEMLFLGAIVIGPWVIHAVLGFILHPAAMILAMVIPFVFEIGMVIYWMRKRGIGYGYFKFSRYPYAIFIFQLLTLMLMAILFYRFDGKNESTFYPAWIMTISCTITAIIGPVAEELLFRGLILEHLRRNFGSIVAIIMTSLLFGILHLPKGAFIHTVIMSIIFCYLVITFKNLILPISLHIGWNTWGIVRSTPPEIARPILIVAIVVIVALTVVGMITQEHQDDIHLVTPPGEWGNHTRQ